jgi:hypothetical protein
MCCEPSSDNLLGLRADDALDWLGILEDQEGRDTLDAELRSSLWIFIHVQFANEVAPPDSAASCSSTGAIILHGPHHGAQQSSSTGSFFDAPTTARAKVSSVTTPNLPI